MEDRTVLLYSGGLDSWLTRQLHKDSIDTYLYVDLNLPYSGWESSMLPSDVIVERLDLSNYVNKYTHILPLRNLYLVMLASYYGNRIWLNQVSGDVNTDKDAIFYEKAGSLLTYIHSNTAHNIHHSPMCNVFVEAPYGHLTKAEILRLYKDKGGDLEEAVSEVRSCYFLDNGERCKKCKACFRNWVAFYLNGKDTDVDANYVLNEVSPYLTRLRPSSGRYYADPTSKEYSEIIQALQLKFNISI